VKRLVFFFAMVCALSALGQTVDAPMSVVVHGESMSFSEFGSAVHGHKKAQKFYRRAKYYSYLAHHPRYAKVLRNASALGSFAGGLYCSVLLSDAFRERDSNLPITTLATLGAWQGFRSAWQTITGPSSAEEYALLREMYLEEAVRLYTAETLK
jgi:hypothetical protein